MNRRVFLGTVAGTLLAARLAAEAQQAGTVYRVGVLSGGSAVTAGVDPLRAEDQLRALGYIEGRNLVVERRSWSAPGCRGQSYWPSSLAQVDSPLQIDRDDAHVFDSAFGEPPAARWASRQARSSAGRVNISQRHHDPRGASWRGFAHRPLLPAHK
jgi:hypothetical protein